MASVCIKNLTIAMSEGAKFCMQQLNDANFEAWVVGGSVRDAILGKEPYDFDIATNALPQQTEKLFQGAGLTTFNQGAKHGTIGVVVPKKNDPDATEAIEITTYRVEGKYTDGRHPDSVEFVTSIEEDLERRDFTMNAIAYHPDKGLIDPYNGIADIEAKTIRCVGDPKRRFKEDGLRMLRACRFKSQLGFDIEEETWAEAVRQKAGVLFLSSERVTSEITKLLQGEFVLDSLTECADVLETAIPEITACRGFDQHTKYHAFDVWIHTANVVSHVKNTPLLRWTALCHDFGKPSTFFIGENGQGHFYGHAVQGKQIAKNVMARVNLSTTMKQQLVMLVERHNDTLAPERASIIKTIRLMDGNVWLFRQLLSLKRADSLGHATQYTGQVDTYDRIEALLDEMIAEGCVFNVKDLKINGRDLIEIGVPEGPRIKERLNVALEWVQTGVCKNEHGELLEQMKKNLEK